MKPTFILMLVVWCLIGCQKTNSDPEGFGRLKLKNNTPEIVKEDFTQKYQLERISEVVLEEKEDYQLSVIGKICIGDNNNIYVLDQVGTKVMVYSPNGKVIKKIGGKIGDAPGEFDRISSIIVKGDTLICYDDMLQRISIFNGQGELLSYFNPHGIGIRPYGSAVAITRDNIVLHAQSDTLSTFPNDKSKASFTRLICALDFSGWPLKYFGEWNERTLDRQLLQIFPGVPFLTTDRTSGNTYLCLNEVPRILEYDSDFTLKRVINTETPITQMLPPREKKFSYFDYLKGHPPYSFISSFEVSQQHNTLAVIQAHVISKPDRELKKSPIEERKFYISIFDLKTGGLLITDHSLPIFSRLRAKDAMLTYPMDIDSNGLIYILEDHTPGQIMVGKYKVVSIKGNAVS